MGVDCGIGLRLRYVGLDWLVLGWLLWGELVITVLIQSGVGKGWGKGPGLGNGVKVGWEIVDRVVGVFRRLVSFDYDG